MPIQALTYAQMKSLKVSGLLIWWLKFEMLFQQVGHMSQKAYNPHGTVHLHTLWLTFCGTHYFTDDEHDHEEDLEPFTTLKDLLHDIDPLTGFNIEIKYCCREEVGGPLDARVLLVFFNRRDPLKRACATLKSATHTWTASWNVCCPWPTPDALSSHVLILIFVQCEKVSQVTLALSSLVLG
jgi:hypothetical protein